LLLVLLLLLLLFLLLLLCTQSFRQEPMNGSLLDPPDG
jgi:hypothetical protein